MDWKIKELNTHVEKIKNSGLKHRYRKMFTTVSDQLIAYYYFHNH